LSSYRRLHCQAIDAMLKLMTSGERRRMIDPVRTSEQFRLERLSKLEQRRQRGYRRRQTVPDLRGSDGKGPITDCFVI